MTTRYDKFQQFRNYYRSVLVDIIDAQYNDFNLAEKLVLDRIEFINKKCAHLNYSKLEVAAIVVQFINELKLDCKKEFINRIKQTIKFDKYEVVSQKFWNNFDGTTKYNNSYSKNEYNDSWMISMTCL